jgi:hypothetical protein
MLSFVAFNYYSATAQPVSTINVVVVMLIFFYSVNRIFQTLSTWWDVLYETITQLLSTFKSAE